MKKRIKLLLLIGFCQCSIGQEVNFEGKKIIVTQLFEEYKTLKCAANVPAPQSLMTFAFFKEFLKTVNVSKVSRLLT